MGIRISYFKNNFKKGLKEVIIENFTAFQEWYLNRHNESMEEFGEPFGTEELKAYFAQNPNFEKDFDTLEKMLLDEITSEFIGNYCDLWDRDSLMLEFFGPSIYKRWYEASTEIVIATQDQEFIKLWNYLIKGRSLRDNAPFDDYNKEDNIGFLDLSEIAVLKEKIGFHFGDKDAVRKYGAEDDKSTGLICVLNALEELDDRNVEIITMIANI